MWIHINFWFKKPGKVHCLNPKQYTQLIVLFNQLLQPRWLFPMKFFLFEPNPHCFLAIKTNYFVSFILAYRLYHIHLPSFIVGYDIDLNGHDERNGKYFLNILNAFTDYTLSGNLNPAPYWFKKFPKREKATIHMFHCMLNQFTNSRKAELLFYAKMYVIYKKGSKK